MSADHTLRHEHEMNRIEAARVRRLAEHEAEIRRQAHDRWWRRLSPLMPFETPVPSGDFHGCVE